MSPLHSIHSVHFLQVFISLHLTLHFLKGGIDSVSDIFLARSIWFMSPLHSFHSVHFLQVFISLHLTLHFLKGGIDSVSAELIHEFQMENKTAVVVSIVMK